MTHRKKAAALLLAFLLLLSCAGCTVPTLGFASYDVSGYITALLKSSYTGEHETFMELAGVPQATAQENNTTTVENAAVIFCNLYQVNPTEKQMTQIQEIMRQAYVSAKYTVKASEKTADGYYLEVDITPITNFKGRQSTMSRLLMEAEEEAKSTLAQPEEESSSEGEYGEDYYGEEEYGVEGETSSDTGSAVSENQPVVITLTQVRDELYTEKVLAFCREELKGINYGDSITISLEIRQTETGELQFDLNQVQTIDKTVVQLTK